jgi:3-hydroxyisobutyrate dehydrogenase
MKLGFIGIGLMGKPMTLRLLAAGHEVAVWNRSADKLAEVLARGARRAGSPAEVARAADIVMMCVTDQKAVEAVLFHEQGIVHGAGAGKLVVDFSSIAPASARVFAARLEAKGIGLVDAPVSGGVAGAEQGTLAIMAGGRPEHVERARPVVMHLAARFTRMGEAGAGQLTKLCNQAIVGSLVAVIAEAMRLAEAAGVDSKMLPEALKGGFADSLPLQIFGARMAARRFDPPLAAAATMLKDLQNVAAAAGEADVWMPMVERAIELYRRLDPVREPSAMVEMRRAQ